jgi:hypothetical protein
MTPMGRILTDLLSISCGPAIAGETPLSVSVSPIRVIRVLFLKAGELRFKVIGGECEALFI